MHVRGGPVIYAYFMHTKLSENYGATHSSSLLDTKAMYHAINRLMAHIKKEISAQPGASFYLTVGAATYMLLVQPDGDLAAYTESIPTSLAHTLFVNWDALRSRATRFYCTLTSDESTAEGLSINKTLGFFQALGAPLPHSRD